MTLQKKILWWLPTFLWMGLIFSFSAQPSLRASAVAWQDFFIRKAAHITEYFILTILAYTSLKQTTGLSRKTLLLCVLIFTFFFAISDEFHQTFVYDRTGKLKDVFIDALGIVSALLSLRFLRGRD